MNIRNFIFAAFAFLPWCAISAAAQETGPVYRENLQNSAGKYPEQRYKPMFVSPERQAQQITAKMDSLLNLSEKQYKKLYKLHLKEAQQQMENGLADGRPPMGSRPDRGPGAHPGGGNFPMRGGGMGPGGHPRGGFGQQPPVQLQDASDAVKTLEEQRAKEEKRKQKMEKKIRKILTEEQYACWQEERMRLTAEPGNPRPRPHMELSDPRL